MLLQPLDERARPLLEILLHLHLAADGAQVAPEFAATGFELLGDGGEEDLHWRARLLARKVPMSDGL